MGFIEVSVCGVVAEIQDFDGGFIVLLDVSEGEDEGTNRVVCRITDEQAGRLRRSIDIGQSLLLKGEPSGPFPEVAVSSLMKI